MKRIFILYLFFILQLAAFAQKIPSIAGVDFASSYSTCKEKFDNKFNGGQTSYQESANLLKYFNVRFADNFFDWVTFGFQRDTNGNSLLNSADFIIFYKLNESEKAKQKRDELFAFYKQKYEFRWSDIGKDGWKYYVLGYDPIISENGFITICIIQTPEYLFLDVAYGPINFINPQDEI